MRKVLLSVSARRLGAIMAVRSVAVGRARGDYDIDVLLVPAESSPQRSDYNGWDQSAAPLKVLLQCFDLAVLFSLEPPHVLVIDAAWLPVEIEEQAPNWSAISRRLPRLRRERELMFRGGEENT